MAHEATSIAASDPIAPAPPDVATTVDESSPAWLGVARWVVAAWAAGVALMLARLFRGTWRASRLSATAEQINDGPLADALRSLARRWSMRVVPALARAEGIVMPKVIGLLRPMVLLPVSAISCLSPDELEMILAHELAHVRRHDMWVNLLQRVAEAVLFFNPPLWYLSRRIGTLREYCCDELTCRATARTHDQPGDAEARTRYASALLRVVELVRTNPAARGRAGHARWSDAAALMAAGRSPSELRRRVARLFDEPLYEPVRLSRGGIVAAIVLTTALVTAPSLMKAESRTAGPDEQEQSVDDESASTGDKAESPGDDRPGKTTSEASAAQSEPREWTPGESVEIRVVNARTKAPMPGVRVQFDFAGGTDGKPDYFHDTLEQTTDFQGRAEIRLPQRRPRKIYVHPYPEKPGFAHVSAQWGEGASPPVLPKSFTLPLEPATAIGGVVQDEQGHPIPGVSVRVYHNQDSYSGNPQLHASVDKKTTTDRSGRWRIDAMPAKIVGETPWIYLAHPDYVSDAIRPYLNLYPIRPSPPLEALRGQTAVMTMRKGVSLEGRVCDEAGRPIAGVSVYNMKLYWLQKYGGKPVAITDADGRFRIAHADSREVLTFQARRYSPELIETAGGTGFPREIVLKSGRPVRGQVVDDAGKPVAGARVGVDLWRKHDDRLNLETVTDLDGRFCLNDAPLEGAQYRIHKDGYMYVERFPMVPSLTPEAAKPDYVVTLKPPLRVVGSIVDAETNKPLPRCFVVYGWDPSDGRATCWPRGDYNAKTITDGRYEFSLEQEIPYRIRVEAEGYLSAVSRPLKPNAPDRGQVTCDFRLTKAAPLRGTVLGPDGKPAADAEVILATQAVEVRDRNASSSSRSLNRTAQTDPAGRFEFIPEVEPFYLVALHEQGFAKLTETEFAASPILRLEPWTAANSSFKAERRPRAATPAKSAAKPKAPAKRSAEEVLFEDNFAGSLSDKWEVVGLAKTDYRIRNGGLEMRVQPGKATKMTSKLRVTLPFTTSDTVTASVKVTLLDDFTEEGELAGIFLFDETGPEFGAKKQRVDNQLMFAPPQYAFRGKSGEEGDPKKHERRYTFATPEAGPLRIIVDRGNAFFQVGPSANDKYLNFFHSAIRENSKQRGFALVAAGGPAGANHWVRFEAFRVVRTNSR